MPLTHENSCRQEPPGRESNSALTIPPAASPGISVVVTPWNAFACAALAMSALSLAFALGRASWQVTLDSSASDSAANETNLSELNIESAHREPATEYNRLEVDRGSDERVPRHTRELR
jgi:hypothetical protein